MHDRPTTLRSTAASTNGAAFFSPTIATANGTLAMVKTRSPLMSQGASGSLAKAVTYNRSPGGTTARRTPRRTTRINARSFAQRVWVTYLTQLWTSLPTATRAKWQPLATRRRLSQRLAFLGANLTRFSADLPPTTVP